MRRRGKDPTAGMTASFLLGYAFPHGTSRVVRRLVQLSLGLVLYGFSTSLLVLAGLGLDPWDVFHQGLARHSSLAIGTCGIIVSGAVLLLWIPLRQVPGLGTLANAVAVGLVMDITLRLLSPPSSLVVRALILVAGVVLNGLATGAYIGAGLGPGARDGLMTGLAARGLSLRAARTGIEATVLAVGFLLGGSVGIGTVLYALSIGPIAHFSLPLLAIDPAPQRKRSEAGFRHCKQGRSLISPGSPRACSQSKAGPGTPIGGTQGEDVWWRRRDSNLRPRAYESPALPLSYAAENVLTANDRSVALLVYPLPHQD